MCAGFHRVCHCCACPSADGLCCNYVCRLHLQCCYCSPIATHLICSGMYETAVPAMWPHKQSNAATKAPVQKCGLETRLGLLERPLSSGLLLCIGIFSQFPSTLLTNKIAFALLHAHHTTHIHTACTIVRPSATTARISQHHG